MKNAEEIYAGKKPLRDLGIQAVNEHTLRFELGRPVADFEYHLALPTLAPSRAIPADPAQLVTSGPYKISSWEKGRRLRLTRNEFYQGGSKDRPDVEFSFIDDDGIALKLYEKGSLDFLRRLPNTYVPKFKNSPEFHWLAVTRLDYLGFGPHLQKDAAFRKALALSLDYNELQKIFSAEGLPPGCPGVPVSWINGPMPCLRQDLVAAKKSFSGISAPAGVLRLAYSTQGGEDHRRAAEWEQNQWQKSLGLKISVKGLENKLFLAELKNNPPDIYRKGLAPDRPTCLAALEKFTEKDSGNYLDLGAEFFKIVEGLENAATDSQRKDLCLKGLRLLIDGSHIIPLGSMHFAILAKTNFTGWRMNQMNQLDLANLKVTGP